ncbi:hypothetical protein B9G99_10675 [Kushneria konosiri]|uniref:Uncharacterized protein n=2 Tax=Kushneria TaxID=504090 RepID=A0A240UML4_9GAMM|nr:hypothetical protein B9G99_10675 [Kushneria konosiri]ART62366.1 hypothetical protein B9H00_04155 [Kushneria marisflavi]
MPSAFHGDLTSPVAFKGQIRQRKDISAPHLIYEGVRRFREGRNDGGERDRKTPAFRRLALGEAQ